MCVTFYIPLPVFVFFLALFLCILNQINQNLYSRRRYQLIFNSTFLFLFAGITHNAT